MASRWLYLLYLLLVVEINLLTTSLSRDEIFGLGVLHMDGELPAVTIFTSSETLVTFRFPEPTRLIPPCTSSSTCCNIAADVIFMSQGHQGRAVVMARLEDAIGLMEIQWFGRSDISNPASSILTISQQNQIGSCDPLGIVNISNAWVVYCVQSQLLFRCDLEVNFTNLASSQLSCRFLERIDVREPSNFLFLPSANSVFFTDASYLYSINPDNDRLNIFAFLDGASCKHLDHFQDQLLLYCAPGVAMDVALDRTKRIQNINESGVTFVCYQSNMAFTVGQNAHCTQVSFNNRSLLLNISSFVDAKCVMQEKGPLIFVADAFGGIVILDGEQLQIIRRLPEVCDVTSPCRRIQVYAAAASALLVVFKQTGRAQALLLDQAWRDSSAVVLSANVSRLFPLFTTTQFRMPSTTSDSHDSLEFSSTIIISVAVAAGTISVVVLAICITTISVAISVAAKRKKKKTYSVQDLSRSANGSSADLIDDTHSPSPHAAASSGPPDTHSGGSVHLGDSAPPPEGTPYIDELPTLQPAATPLSFPSGRSNRHLASNSSLPRVPESTTSPRPLELAERGHSTNQNHLSSCDPRTPSASATGHVPSLNGACGEGRGVEGRGVGSHAGISPEGFNEMMHQHDIGTYHVCNLQVNTEASQDVNGGARRQSSAFSTI